MMTPDIAMMFEFSRQWLIDLHSATAGLSTFKLVTVNQFGTMPISTGT
jgi:succinylglutamate desuccinylase